MLCAIRKGFCPEAVVSSESQQKMGTAYLRSGTPLWKRGMRVVGDGGRDSGKQLAGS